MFVSWEFGFNGDENWTGGFFRNKLHASVAPLLAELAEKEKELMEAIRNTEEPPARFVLKSKDPGNTPISMLLRVACCLLQSLMALIVGSKS